MRKVLSIIFTRIAGVLIFLILLGLANFLSFDNPNYLLVVGFLNDNVLLILLFSFIFFLAELFEVFVFPFNIFYPLLNAIGALFLIEFIKRILEIFLLYPLDILQIVISAIVFVIVLIVGYVKIILRLVYSEKKRRKSFVDTLNDFFTTLNEKMRRKS